LSGSDGGDSLSISGIVKLCESPGRAGGFPVVIIHSAQSLPYLSTLVENLHSYLDILINCVIRVGEITSNEITISSSLVILETAEKLYSEKICKLDGYIDNSCYHDIIFGMRYINAI